MIPERIAEALLARLPGPAELKQRPHDEKGACDAGDPDDVIPHDQGVVVGREHGDERRRGDEKHRGAHDVPAPDLPALLLLDPRAFLPQRLMKQRPVHAIERGSRATEGDVVSVMNLQSKRTVTGIVVGRGQVAIAVTPQRPTETSSLNAAPAAPLSVANAGPAAAAKAE